MVFKQRVSSEILVMKPKQVAFLAFAALHHNPSSFFSLLLAD